MKVVTIVLPLIFVLSACGKSTTDTAEQPLKATDIIFNRAEDGASEMQFVHRVLSNESSTAVSKWIEKQAGGWQVHPSETGLVPEWCVAFTQKNVSLCRYEDMAVYRHDSEQWETTLAEADADLFDQLDALRQQAQ